MRHTFATRALESEMKPIGSIKIARTRKYSNPNEPLWTCNP